MSTWSDRAADINGGCRGREGVAGKCLGRFAAVTCLRHGCIRRRPLGFFPSQARRESNLLSTTQPCTHDRAQRPLAAREFAPRALIACLQACADNHAGFAQAQTPRAWPTTRLLRAVRSEHRRPWRAAIDTSCTAMATVTSDIFQPSKFGGKYTVTLIPGAPPATDRPPRNALTFCLAQVTALARKSPSL